VCEAYDSSRQALVAVKQVRRLFENLSSCKRTLREIAILTALNHDCVMKVHDIFVPRDEVESFSELYIVMELCDSDLRKLMALDVELTTGHIKWLMYNLMRGLAYLHASGVCHRDLKPANCLVNEHCSVKITDFNLSCIIGSADGEDGEPLRPPSPMDSAGCGRPRRAQRELTSHVVTRHYRAPEVILLQRKYTHKIDIWSAACIFAELLQTLPSGPRFSERGPLFPGSCSYPLSPGPPSRSSKHGRDQLSLIFDLLGTPSEAQIARLDRVDARRYVQRFEARVGNGVKACMPHAREDELQLLDQMLAFSPDGRVSAQQAIQERFFDDVRQEKGAEDFGSVQRIHLDFDEGGHESWLASESGLRGCILEVMRFCKGEHSSAGSAELPVTAAHLGAGDSLEHASDCHKEQPAASKGEDQAVGCAPLMAAAHEAAVGGC
jgi:mitogen-activated protein kinase 1/3